MMSPDKADARSNDELALERHKAYRGKIQTLTKCPLVAPADFSVWYTPAVAAPSRAIHRNPALAYDTRTRATPPPSSPTLAACWALATSELAAGDAVLRLHDLDELAARVIEAADVAHAVATSRLVLGIQAAQAANRIVAALSAVSAP